MIEENKRILLDVRPEQDQISTGLQEPQFMAKIELAVYNNGNINLNVAESDHELTTQELEIIFRNVYEQLFETRIAQKALELFKSRL